MDAVYVFGGKHFTVIDSRKDYGEVRNITVGHLDNRMVMIGWVQRGEAHHVFSMRKANEREIKRYGERLKSG